MRFAGIASKSAFVYCDSHSNLGPTDLQIR